jgi:glycosyltransferase involved in cell wall biosynthesis
MSSLSAPLITVLLPVKNGMPFLSEAVASILQQTYRDFELLIIDDGSTDETTSYLKSLRDPRLRIRRNEQSQGVARCLNQGLALAATPFIARQDADDISEPERLGRQLAYLTDHPECAVLGTQGWMVDEAGNKLQPFPWRPTGEAEMAAALRVASPFIHGSVLLRREAVKEVGGYREEIRYAEDFDLWLRLANKYKLANLPDSLYRYRVHGGQVCTANQQQASLDSWLCLVLQAERQCRGGEDSLSILDEKQLAAIKERRIWRPRGNWAERVRVLWHYAQLLQADSPRRALVAKFLAITGGW